MNRRIDMRCLQNLKDDQVYEDNLIFPYAFKKSQIKMIKFTESIQERLIFPLKMSGSSRSGEGCANGSEVRPVRVHKGVLALDREPLLFEADHGLDSKHKHEEVA